MKNLLYILISLVGMSCSEKKSDVYVEIAGYKTLANPETVIRFDDKFPVYLDLKDSVLFIVNRNSDKCMAAVDVRTGRIIKELGTKGNGPNDVFGPEFIVNNPVMDAVDSFLYFADVNKYRFLKVNAMDTAKMNFEILSEFPSEIYPSGNINFSDSIIVGRRISSAVNEMFFIYDREGRKMQPIGYYPAVKNLTNDLTYFYASNVAANKSENKIIAGMYFFDMLHVFDFKGNRLKSFSFSEKAVPEVNVESGILDLQGGYTGFSLTYPLEKHIYLKRNEVSTELVNGEQQETAQTSVLKFDWDGNLIDAYKFDRNVNWFCVNREETELYAISNLVENDLEYYDILRYGLK